MTTDQPQQLPPMALQLVWTVAPANPAVDTHAELLRAVAGEVYKQPFGSYERPELAAAAEELLAALQSQLPREATGEIPAVPADFDERTAAGGEGIQVGPLLAMHQTGLFNGERGLAHLEAAVAGAAGVAWGGPAPDVAGWEQCLAHLLDDLRTGRLEGLLDPTAIGRLIFPPDDAPPDCARCHGAPAGDPAWDARTADQLCPDGQCGRCWGCRRAAAAAGAAGARPLRELTG